MSSVPTNIDQRAADSPTMRRALRWISARCLRWVYRDQCLLHAERIPSSGPVLLIGNHPNDLPDVLLGYIVTPRPVRYLATVSAATGWLSRKTYEWQGVIPVARLRDARKLQAAGVDVMAINRRATDTVAAALAAGGVVAAFPEGGVRDGVELAEFKTGVASMALKYIDDDANNDVLVVPFGIQYEAARTPGSDVLSVIGPPFSLRRWREQQPPEAGGAGALTRAMHAAVRAITRNAASWDAAEQRDLIVAAVAAGTHPTAPLTVAPGHMQRLDRAISALANSGVAAEHDAAPDATRALDALTAAARQLAGAVHRAGGIPTSSVDHARLLFALEVTPEQAPVPSVALWMGAPVAAIGWAVHGPLFLAIWALAQRLAKARSDVVALCYVPGIFIIVLGYLLVTLVGALAANAAGLSALWLLPMLWLLPRLGDLAVRWRSAYRGWRLVARARTWPTAERAALRDAAATVQTAWARVHVSVGD